MGTETQVHSLLMDRLGQIDNRIGALAAKVDKVGDRQDAQAQRFDEKLDQQARQLTRIETQAEERTKFLHAQRDSDKEELEEKTAAIKVRLEKLEQRRISVWEAGGVATGGGVLALLAAWVGKNVPWLAKLLGISGGG